MADDADGPSNNRIHYTIIDGNQGNPFTIDPTRGEIKVTKLLDREKVSFLVVLGQLGLIYLYIIDEHHFLTLFVKYRFMF